MSILFTSNPEGSSMHYEGEYSLTKEYFKGAIVKSIVDGHLYTLTSNVLGTQSITYDLENDTDNWLKLTV